MTPEPGESSPAPAGPALQLLPLAGFLLWFIVGLPWGPHNEAYDLLVRLDTLSFGQAVAARLPSVLSLRPLGTGLAWLTCRLGGGDSAPTQFLNAFLALLAWWWVAQALPARRVFAAVALLVGGICFAGYIWVFHVHGVFYGPLLLFVAWLVRLARGPVTPRTLGIAAAGAAVAALAHPFALPLVAAFAAGALLERRELRTAAGLRALALVAVTVVALYLVLVPAYKRGVAGDPLQGWRVTFETTEVNRLVSFAALALAALGLHGCATGARRWALVAGGLVLGGALLVLGWPVLPLWLAAAALACARQGRWILLALLGSCALLPCVNPTGSPTYAIFAMFVAAAITAFDLDLESRLAWLGEPVAALVLAGALALAIALRAGVAVPVASAAARPLLAERERTVQLTTLVERFLRSGERAHPLVFARGSGNPIDLDATDRRFRPPTESRHLGTWLGHRRGAEPPEGDTLYVAFGGDPLAAGGRVLLAVHGRLAGDAIVFRRAAAGTAAAPSSDTHADHGP